jgi:nitroreductase
MALIHDVLDVARWAPSGDNTQPWRFEIRSETSAFIHGYDTRDRCVYDLDGHASELSHGALLETVELAATRFEAKARCTIVDDTPGHAIYRVELEPTPGLPSHPLARFIERRTVQRRPMQRSALDASERAALAAPAHGFTVTFLESLRRRWQAAALNMRNGALRLSLPEAYDVHRAVIEWNASTSEDRLPDRALGADPMLRASMRFAMQDWRRVELLNRFAFGTVLPPLALDFVPGLLCAAHFALIAPQEPETLAARVDAGRAMQRLWLTATSFGLQMQPSYTPLVFARYARSGRRFSRAAHADAAGRAVLRGLERLLGEETASRTVFLGRVGRSRPAQARSLRLPLDRLIVTSIPSSMPTERRSGHAA